MTEKKGDKEILFPRSITLKGLKNFDIADDVCILIDRVNVVDCDNLDSADLCSQCIFDSATFDIDILINYLLENKIATKAELLDIELSGDW